MPDDHVADWLLTPNKDLDMQMPIDLSDTEKGMNKILRLLYFIEIGEADLWVHAVYVRKFLMK